jgi:hypothetical protein
VGTQDWQQYAVVLDVPKDSAVIRLGILLVRKGKVWFDDLKLETVGPEVRVTDIWRWADPAYKKEANLALQRYSLTQEELDRLPGQPVNLQWE